MELESVYRELHDPLTRRLERMVGDARTAEDLRQEAFARAWKSAPRDAGRGHLRGWVHRTAHNLAVDELRRRGLREVVTMTTSWLAPRRLARPRTALPPPRPWRR